VFEIGPRLDVRSRVLLVGVRSLRKKPKGPRSVRGSDRARGRPDGRTRVNPC
jgi:hypothetical protein